MRASYRFVTAASLVRHHRILPDEAGRMVREWDRYVRHRHERGKSPESTAEHLVRFERQRIAKPYPSSARRDGLRRWSSEERSRVRAPVTPELADRMIADSLRREAAEHAERGHPLRAAALVEEAEEIDHRSRRDVGQRRRRRSPLVQKKRLPPRFSPHAARSLDVTRRLDRRPFCRAGTETATLIFPPGTSEREVRTWIERNGQRGRVRFTGIDVSPTTGSVRVRQRNPNDFIEDSFATILLSPRSGVRAVIGCPRPERERAGRRRRSGR